MDLRVLLPFQEIGSGYLGVRKEVYEKRMRYLVVLRYGFPVLDKGQKKVIYNESKNLIEHDVILKVFDDYEDAIRYVPEGYSKEDIRVIEIDDEDFDRMLKPEYAKRFSEAMLTEVRHIQSALELLHKYHYLPTGMFYDAFNGLEDVKQACSFLKKVWGEVE
jgi:hypothetical protein